MFSCILSLQNPSPISPSGLEKTQSSLGFFMADLGRRLFTTHFYLSTEGVNALKNSGKSGLFNTLYPKVNRSKN